MKKKVSMLFAALLCLSMGLTGCGTNKENGKEDTKEELTKVTLNEVAHSVFYAPQYVAIEEGYFVEEGIKLELVTGFGADKVMSGLLDCYTDEKMPSINNVFTTQTLNDIFESDVDVKEALDSAQDTLENEFAE